MESANGLSNPKGFVYTGKSSPVSPFSFFINPTSYAPSPAEPKPNPKSSDGVTYHQRCSSESFLLEEQPSWLDDLLNDTDTTLFHRGHRRSASDSYAYMGEAVEKFSIRDQESNHETIGTTSRSQTLYKDGENTSIETMAIYFDKKEESEEVVSYVAVEQRREDTNSTNLEGFADKADGSQVKPSAGKTEGKRAKQHNAHRSRVRKLKYIAHLERSVQNLQTEGSEISAALEFLEQQNMILVLENRALRQRLETISQEQLIKQWEQEMLEREIVRLQNVYHAQKQQQQQQQQSHHQYPKHRRNKSRDHHDQINDFQMNNKEASSSKSSTNGSVQI